MALLVLSCARDGSDPRAVLVRYLEAVYSDDPEEAYAHLCDDDRAYRTLEGYVALEGMQDSEIVRELASRATFEVLSLKTQGNRARARVRVTQPDMSQALGIAMQKGFGEGSGFESAAKAATSAPLGMQTLEKGYALVRQPDGWRVRLNWRHEQEIASYLGAARLHEQEGNAEQAVALYRLALSLDDALFDVERRVAELEETLAEAEDGEAEDSESGEAEWEPEWEVEQEEVDADAAAIDSALEEAEERGGAVDPELGLRSAENGMQRAQHNRELLRQLAREEIEAQGGDPDLVERAEQVPFDEGR